MTEKQLEEQINVLREKLENLRENRASEENSKLYRKTFKYKNSYSCPKPGEYWWLYMRVIVVEGSRIIVQRFQTDCDGKMELETKAVVFNPRLNESGYLEISDHEYVEALSVFQNKVMNL